MHNPAIGGIADRVRPEQFAVPEHQRLYRTILRLHRAIGAVDVASLAAHLHETVPAEADALVDLAVDAVNAVGNHTLWPEHAAAVLRAAAREEFGGLAEQIRRWADSPLVEPADVALRIRTAIDQIGVRYRPKGRDVIIARDAVEKDDAPLWPGRVSFGTLTLFVGPGGLGKGLTYVDITARYTTGGPFPDCENPNPPGRALIISTEENEGQLRRRLRAAGADLDRVGIVRLGAAFGFTLNDIPMLTRWLDEAGGEVGLLVIDPASAHMGRSDDHKNAELRAALGPLLALAEERNLAVLMVGHTNKAEGKSAANRVSGSAAWVNVCRNAFLFVQDPDEPKRSLILAVKSNVSELAPGLAFRRVAGPAGTKAGKAEWEEGTIPMSADQWLAERAAEEKGCKKRGPAPTKTRECLEWLLSAMNGRPIAVGEALRLAKDAGFSVGTAYNAASLGKIEECDSFGRKWWRPPRTSGSEEDVPPIPTNLPP